jgi:hypothetical protein
MEPEIYIEAAWKEVALLPLPSVMSNTSQGFKITLSEAMDEFWRSAPQQPAHGDSCALPTMGLLVKMIGVWLE